MNLRLQSRVFWLLALLGHAAAAGLWGWLMPRGFPVATRWFWANRALPAGAIAIILATLWAGRRGNLGVVRAALLAIAGVWLAAAICSRVVFPISFSWRFLVFVVMAAAMSLAAYAPALKTTRWPRWTPLAVLVGMLIGALLPLTQRAEFASTHPLDVAMPEPITDFPGGNVIRRDGVQVQPREGMVTLQRGGYFMFVQ